MTRDNKNVTLTPHEIELIQSALHTQEKILSVQTRATKDSKLRARLSELQSVLDKLGRETKNRAAGKSFLQPQGWSHFARSLFS